MKWWMRTLGTAALLLLAVTAGIQAETWPLLGFYGLWGEIGLGEEVEYRRANAVSTWVSGLTRELSLSGSGYSYHPNFLTWEGHSRLSWGRKTELQEGALRLGLLPRHSTPVNLTIQRSQEQETEDFQPVRQSRVDSMQAQALLAAYAEPIFLNWSVSEIVYEDPETPRHNLVWQGSAATTKRLGRDHDLTVKYEQLASQDLIEETEASRRTFRAKMESRFLYDLLLLRSEYQEAQETGQVDTGRRQATEELTIHHRPDWKSKVRVAAEEVRVGERLNSRTEAGAQTGGDLGRGWRVTLDGKASVKQGDGVIRRGLDCGTHLGWGGLFGPFQLSAGAGLIWRPEWGEGAYSFFVRHEASRLWTSPLSDPEARPLDNRRVDLNTVEVYLPRELTPLECWVDYDLLVIGEQEGSAEKVYLCWRPGSRVSAGQDVWVNYRYLSPAGNSQQVQDSTNVTVTTNAANLSLGVMANSTQLREYSETRGDRVQNESGTLIQLGMVDGPFSVTTALNEREGVEYRASTVTYRRAGMSLSQSIERYEAADWRRARGVTRLNASLRGGGAAKLEGFTQYLRGRWMGTKDSEERALQTGLQLIAAPASNCSVSGSLSYLKDWVAATRDQAVATLKVDWWRGQLIVRLDSELQEDLGRNSGRGEFRLTLLRQF